MTTTTEQQQHTSYSKERFVLEHTEYGRILRLTEPSIVAFYRINPTVEEEVLKEYYKQTIVPWLENRHQKQGYGPGAYPIDVYLMDCILVVVTDSATYQPWESIPDLSKYVTKVNVERLEKPMPKAQQ
jgi:hypothetical protein